MDYSFSLIQRDVSVSKSIRSDVDRMVFSAMRRQHVLARDTIFVSCRKSESEVFSMVVW